MEMNKLKKLTGSLVLALGFGAGCSTPSSVVQPPADPAQVEASINESMTKLRSLDLVDVDRLVLDLPAQATQCYGLPCPGSQWVQVYQNEHARQAPRLAALADAAEEANREITTPAADLSGADAAVQSLRDLQIIDTSGLVMSQPANNPLCYNLPCPDDEAKATRDNDLRLARLVATVELAKKSGI
jgi:hypothetical protein